MEGELRLAKPADLLICSDQMCMGYLPVYSWILRSMLIYNTFLVLKAPQIIVRNISDLSDI